MQTRRLTALSALVLAAAPLVACAANDEDAHDEISCEEVVTQAAYETMRQLAAAGLASDPNALRDALPEGAASPDDDAVRVPEYAVFTEQYDDAEQATLLSALGSAQVGVGDVFDSEALYAATSRDGDCSGWVTDD